MVNESLPVSLELFQGFSLSLLTLVLCWYSICQESNRSILTTSKHAFANRNLRNEWIYSSADPL